jgi:hypothetical protein
MSLDALRACVGRWTGSSTLQDPMHDIAEEGASSADVVPVIGGRFVRIDYTWSYRDAPQEGSLLIGCDPKGDACTAHWIDSWHMGHAAMHCTGSASGSTISVRGSYAVPDNPDWGWRIDIGAGSDDLTIAMFNISPAGEEYPAVYAVYRRAVG